MLYTRDSKYIYIYIYIKEKRLVPSLTLLASGFSVLSLLGLPLKPSELLTKKHTEKKREKKIIIIKNNGCSDLRHHSRNNPSLLSGHLLHHHSRHLQILLVPFHTRILLNSISPLRKMPNRSVLSLILVAAVVLGLVFDLSFAHGSHGHHQCSHGHGDHHHQQHRHEEDVSVKSRLLPEELAEEEDMKLYGFGRPYDDYDHETVGSSELSGFGLWTRALGCSLLISMASLICLILLPVIFVRGKPSKEIVDSLALFGAGAMLGDAFLHQLPHAFGGGKHSHSHADHHHHGHSGEDHSHAHSLEDLSVGISVLAGIVIFLLVEKVVRYVEDNSKGGNEWSHGHHHHHKNKKLKDDSDSHDTTDKKSKARLELDAAPIDSKENKVTPQISVPRKRNGKSASSKDAANGSTADVKTSQEFPAQAPSNLVFGYLNLFSDGVHNFTDGMALGSAFLLHGSVGGWSRTVFLLAHELPQEIGDFGILVRSGFSVAKALFFNFLSALVALAGTALALLMGKDPGHSSLIEGFTAGGFIYIAVAGVLGEMNSNSKSTVRTTAFQLTSLVLGMAVALGISLVE